MKSGSPRKPVSFLTRQHRNILLTGNRKGNVYVADFNSTSSEGMTCLIQQSRCRRNLVVAQEAVSLELQSYESVGEEKLSKRSSKSRIHQRWPL